MKTYPPLQVIIKGTLNREGDREKENFLIRMYECVYSMNVPDKQTRPKKKSKHVKHSDIEKLQI